MDTQNIPIHVRLWNKHFWLLAMANLLLVMSSYMLVATMPMRMIDRGYSMFQIALVMGVFFIGIYLFGSLSGYLVQRFRRKNVFNVSTLLLLAVTGVLYYLTNLPYHSFDYSLLVLLRFVQGAFYGLSQLVLLSTLIIDTVEAVHRTEANHTATWFGRFAISLGPLAGIMVYKTMSFPSVILLSCIFLGISFVFVNLIRFPFRMPSEDFSRFSCDRFLLKGSHWLFVNVALITTVLGVLLSIEHSPRFYGMLMVGFVIAILAERFVFADADLRSEATTGMIVIGIAILLMINRNQESVSYVVPILIGLGVGLIGSRFLLFFIKMSDHCQRGTSQSTFLLAWETGIGAGLFLSYGLFNMEQPLILWVCLGVLAVSLILYDTFIHSWYVKHKHR
ncbi:MFS transporter [Prevotella scopos JCM 17725]|uniref:Major Facilitator Superfamily protein n=1 Tax=Prevotella scopos JCM 17725 TaxID=1236518 RepID=A0AAX2F1Q2_9BACT|nr:MFS transporter [Prevotella scopos]ANR74270.1 transporter [Prevotella scopos JCM 17725]QUB44866.1 MFS transporter [Prevotella scopos JCM 17725]SHF59874.1 Major Facilitator Superfamily protein [Prevotella scopos JCM 17725]